MNTSSNLSTALQQLGGKDSELFPDIQAMHETSQAVERIMTSASQHGIDIDADTLAAQLETLKTLQELCRLTPATANEIRSETSPTQRIERIQAQARMHGLDLDHDALAMLLQNAAARELQTELSDVELANVSGGLSVPQVVGSVINWGIQWGLIRDPLTPRA